MFRFGDYKANLWQYQKIHKHNDKDVDETVSQNGSHDFDGTGMISDAGRNSSRMRTSHRTANFYRLLVLVLVGIDVLLSVSLLWIIIAVAERAPHQSDTGVQRAGQAEIPVEMELYRFRTGVREKTPFFGAPNASTDAAWSTILNAGLVKLTPEQADKLSAPTARSRRDPTSYVGILEVFHQLHCLNHLRTRLYASDPVIEFGNRHTEHCFEYIRQSLMCLSDVNIAPISWSEKRREYAIHWDTVRQCRNFDKIHQWAVDTEHHEDEEVLYSTG